MSTRVSVRRRAGSAEIQAARVDKAAPHSTHTPGWPHISRQGTCLCELSCCFGRDGCKCDTCNHWTHPAVS